MALARAHLTRLLGDTVPDPDVNRILTRLGFSVAPAVDGWQVTAPAFRVDVTREADLIEDVGRHWGFDRIPATFPRLHTMPRADVGGGRPRPAPSRNPVRRRTAGNVHLLVPGAPGG